MRDTGSNWSIPILDSKGPSFDTNININIIDFWNRYQFQYQYSRFWKSIPIPISIPQFWKFNYNTNSNTENFIIQYQSRSQNQSISQKLLATNCKLKIPHGQINTDILEVDKMPSHYLVFIGLAINLGWHFVQINNKK